VSTTTIERPEADAAAGAPEGPARVTAAAGSAGPAPIYVVCSPSRQVGKTLLARLLAEHYVADARPVAAFDLADEGPQLADFLPERVTLADVYDMRGQMRFFDGLIEDNTVAKVIDVSHRAFNAFFAVAETIGLFEEARRRGIEPLILFLIDPDPLAAETYAMLRRRFPGTSLLPVRNLMVARGLPYGAAFPHASTLAVALELPVLGPGARALIEREKFSFADFGAAPRPDLPRRAGEELQTWLRRLRFQFREIELGLICEQILTVLR
jgi:hypothetical protein